MFKIAGMIGTGNMGSAVAEAVYRSGDVKVLRLSNRRKEKAERTAQRLREIEKAEGGPVLAVTDNSDIAGACDLIFFAVKPQILPDVLKELAPVLAGRKDRFILVTMAAGISCAAFKTMAGGDYPVIRIMPNTPASIGKGVVEYCSEGVTAEDLAAFEQLMAPAGLVDPIAEKQIDAASAVTGCGPAYAYMFINSLADGAVRCGLPRDKAIAYAAAMVEGAAAMVLRSGLHPEQLKDAVCSPGGTTIAGVQALEDAAFRGAVMEAVCAAYDKTVDMGRGGK